MSRHPGALYCVVHTAGSLSQDLETGSPKLAIVNILGV